MASNDRENQYLKAERDVVSRHELAAANRPEPRFKPVSIFFRSDVGVYERNPEFADMGNPEGNIYREYFYVIAEDAKGYRKAWSPENSCFSLEAIERAYEFIAPPIQEWADCQPCYGSEAYDAEGCELDQLEYEMEEDLGPNWRTVAPDVAFAIAVRR